MMLKKKVLLGAVLISLSGLVVAKPQENLKEQPSERQLFYKIDVVDNGSVKQKLTGTFFGKLFLENIKSTPYVREVLKKDGKDYVVMDSVTEGLVLKLTENNMKLEYSELLSLRNVYLDENKKEGNIQVPQVRRNNYYLDDYKLVSGCFVSMVKNDLNVVGLGQKPVGNSYVSIAVCDSKEKLDNLK